MCIKKPFYAALLMQKSSWIQLRKKLLHKLERFFKSMAYQKWIPSRRRVLPFLFRIPRSPCNRHNPLHHHQHELPRLRKMPLDHSLSLKWKAKVLYGHIIPTLRMLRKQISITSFQKPKWPQTKMYTTTDIILSHGVTHFVRSFSFKNLKLEVTDRLLKNFKQWESGFLKLTLRTKWITP